MLSVTIYLSLPQMFMLNKFGITHEKGSNILLLKYP